MEWFRLYGEFATDPKVQSMPEVMQRRLIMVFCLKCSNVLVTLQETDICFALRIDEEQLAETKALFIRKNFIDEDWNVLQWDERQKPSDSSAPRVRAFRERKKQESEALQKQPGNVTETPQSRREETREEETRGKPKTKPPRVPRFDAQAHLVSLGVEPKVAADWLTQRKAKNLEPTETAFDATVTEAEKAGLSLNDAVKECCANGWGGFKAKWLQNEIARGGGGGGTVTSLNKQEALEKRNRTIAMEFAQELQHASK